VDPDASPPKSHNKPEVLGLVWAVLVWVLLAGNVTMPFAEWVLPRQLSRSQYFGFWSVLGTTIIITLPMALVAIERVHHNRKVTVCFLIWSGLFLVGLLAGMLYMAYVSSQIPT
jgi:hypothetical protein